MDNRYIDDYHRKSSIKSYVQFCTISQSRYRLRSHATSHYSCCFTRTCRGGGAPSLRDSTGFIHNHNVDAKCIHRFQYSTMQKLHAFNRHYDKPALTCLVPDYRKSAYKFNTYILRLCRSQSSLPFPTVWQISDRQAEVDPASFLEQPKVKNLGQIESKGVSQIKKKTIFE